MSTPGSLSMRLTQPASWPAAAQWPALLALSALISLVWGGAGLPASLLLGPLLAGLIFGVNGVHLRVPMQPYVVAQGVLGAMVSAGITPAIVTSLGRHGVLFCVVMVATVAGCTGIGWLISRTGLIPGATAVYGTSPGAATAMVLLAEAEGADPRLVAFMQYTRVLLVALSAALVAHFWVGGDGVRPPGAPWLAAVHWGPLTLVLLLALLSQQLARVVRLQAWPLLGPMLVLSTLHALGWISIDLPRGLLAAAYCLLGWQIGLSFRRDSLVHAGRALPIVILSGVSMIGVCALLGWLLSLVAHIDSLTAYLATSPGGLDSIAIIAAASGHVDLPFVLALQAVRLLFAIGLMPVVTRLVVQHSPHLQQETGRAL
jgi:membrane AbrB-like protein